MMLPLVVFCGTILIELSLWGAPGLRWLRVGAGVLAAGVALTTGWLAVSQPSLVLIIVVAASLYRLVNLARTVTARINERYLRQAGRRASLWLIGTQAAALLAWQLVLNRAASYDLWLVVLCLTFTDGLVMLAATVWNLLKTRPPRVDPHAVRDSALPTLTVALPARNETDELEACLTTIVASNYPKLEVLVLDDCSQLRRTPEIIRSFAHAGVRFLQGKVPGDDWLAKNFAYEQLYGEANGELILFCGVDIRLEPNSLRMMVAALQQKKKSMLCLIPRNLVPSPLSLRGSTLVQPMRYAWELAFPRRLFNRPPVLSSCWLARRQLIKDAGGFAAVNRSIVPEAYFAKYSARARDGYTFMQSNSAVGITSNKSLTDQADTTLRVKYPQLHKRLELVFLLTLGELAMTVLPAYILLVDLFGGMRHDSLALMSLDTLVVTTLVYVLVTALTYRAWLMRAFVTLPLAGLIDVLLLNYSLLKYEFASVAWKERNVCIPVMHVIDHLPPLEVTK